MPENQDLNNDNNLRNLLVIDDEPEIVKALSRQFRRTYNVFSSTNAEEAFHILENEHIQVVISDQRMPGMNGVEFFERIKHKYPDALKLILTGYSDIEAVIGAINEGQVFRYVTKPWNPEELNIIIKEAFEKHELITNNRKLMQQLQDANETLEHKVQERTKELEKANQKLIELNSEKNRYIGMVAHDLRNPIGVAESFSALLIEDLHVIDKNTEREYLGHINKSCNFSLDLIHNFLNVSKIEASVFDVNLQAVDYVSFVKEAIKQEQIFARNKEQQIVFSTSIDELTIQIDRNKMQQVLNNLLSNAVKYSMPNTLISVSVEMNDNDVLTSITDQGQGIPANELGQLFTPFHTTSVKPTGKEKSTGLGLSIVKKIIEAHGGKIWAESEVGVGSVFYFTIGIA
ncbi:MAG: hybrid sensor histidine kinase/response regulator [Prolixibacteraceae bacterium]|nr:hybrid sensor histidine kinase/response regulator [Prolixibacteraceae bacterium]